MLQEDANIMELSEALGITESHNVTPRQQSSQELTDQLVKLVFQGRLNFTEVAKELGIGRRRAYRLWDKWKQSEEAQHIDWEWWALYLRVREVNPEKALECLTRIKYRMITEKKELKIQKVSISKQINEIIKFSREQIADPDTSGDTKL